MHWMALRFSLCKTVVRTSSSSIVRICAKALESAGPLVFILLGAAVGVAVGYLIARYSQGSSSANAKLTALQTEYDEYREKVRRHYIETVSAISKIDEQQKSLYRAVANGVTELCRKTSTDDDFFLEQTMHTLGQLESPEKSKKHETDFS